MTGRFADTNIECRQGVMHRSARLYSWYRLYIAQSAPVCITTPSLAWCFIMYSWLVSSSHSHCCALTTLLEKCFQTCHWPVAVALRRSIFIASAQYKSPLGSNAVQQLMSRTWTCSKWQHVAFVWQLYVLSASCLHTQNICGDLNVYRPVQTYTVHILHIYCILDVQCSYNVYTWLTGQVMHSKFVVHTCSRSQIRWCPGGCELKPHWAVTIGMAAPAWINTLMPCYGWVSSAGKHATTQSKGLFKRAATSKCNAFWSSWNCSIESKQFHTWSFNPPW